MIHIKVHTAWPSVPSGPQEFPDRVKIHTSHNQSTGEGMTIAMPRIVSEPNSLGSGKEAPAEIPGVRKHEALV